MAEINVQKKNDRTVVTIGGELTVSHAREIKAALLAAVQGSTAVEVVLGTVGRLDSSFPQLLCSAHRTAAELKRSVTVSGAEQPPIADMLRRSGFTRHTGCRESTRTTCLWLQGPVSE